MSSSHLVTRRFLSAFALAWFIEFFAGILAIGLFSVLALNALTMIGGGLASPEGNYAMFVNSLQLYAPSRALFAACSVLVSLFIAEQLSARYPRKRHLVYAVAGGIVSLVGGLLFPLFSSFLAFVSALIGAAALLGASRLTAVPSEQTSS